MSSHHSRKKDKDEVDPLKNLSNFVKKTIETGIEALSATEDTVRQAVGDISIPTELFNAFKAQAEKAKVEVVKAVTNEVKKTLQKVKVEDLIAKLLEDAVFEIHAEVKLKKGKKGTEPKITKLKVTPKAKKSRKDA